ncbi:MAG: ATP phosphoribosyltransferase regulatory subunit [Verrucomicrobia bacterium]|nr:ATP phosphoribosyltransferase regulatory subunit [Verrucomicrobiota bacterium]
MERLPGFRDFYPEPPPAPSVWSAAARAFLFAKWRETARLYGFQEYDGPPLESLDLYKLKSGGEIVRQLYNFTDKGGREVALRPEMTPTLARMVAAAERGYKKPLKWFSIPQLFRYERQQKGRLREHFQFNADILGERDPGADAEMIALLIDTLRAFGLEAADFVIRLSSRQVWEAFYRRRGGDEARAYEFFQAVDKLERESEEASAKRFEELGFKLDQVRDFIESSEVSEDLAPIMEQLAARGLQDFVRVDYGVIRGLAYYTGPVYEAFDRQGKFRAIAGGGRYDNLIALISRGKVRLPALGFGMGDVVLTELLKERGLLPNLQPVLDVFVLVEDEAFRAESLRLVQGLREAGVATDYGLAPAKSDRQYKLALSRGARFTLRLVSAPDGRVRLKVKKPAQRTEEEIKPVDAVDFIKNQLQLEKGPSLRGEE